MKLINLNIWGGRGGKEKLLKFFDQQRNKADIFCLQEVWSAPYLHLENISAGGKKISHKEVMAYALQEIGAVLTGYIPFFVSNFEENFGLLIFTRKNIEILGEGQLFVHKDKGFMPEGDIGHHARSIQYQTIKINGKPLTIINFHGLWNGKGKADSADRLMQSGKIISFIGTIDTPVILAGDFNLLPDTESLKKIENAGLKNLIREYGITSTRPSFYTKPEKFADYVLVSPEVRVKGFKALEDEISDHLPLELDFEL